LALTKVSIEFVFEIVPLNLYGFFTHVSFLKEIQCPAMLVVAVAELLQ